MKRKPGETVHELAARIRQDAVTCDFTSIADPLDEALRTRFICSISNEAVLKAIFKIKDTDLTFAKAITVANETEDAARVAKETVHGVKNTEIHKINTNAPRGSTSKSPRTNTPSSSSPFPKGTCGRCGRDNHIGKNCPYINTTCNYCKKKGHLESVCLQKKRGKSRKHVKIIHLDTVKMVNAIPQITQAVNIKGHTFIFEVDTGAGDNFCFTHIWNQLGKPSLSATKSRYGSATGDSLPVTGTFTVTAKLPNQSSDSEATLQFTVVQNDTLDILGRDAILKLGIDVNALITSSAAGTNTVKTVFDKLQPENKLQERCRKLCETFPELFKPELGCLRKA